MKYQIAIPSYKRHFTITKKTLGTLTRHNIDPDIVTVFVANPVEKEIYAKELKDTPYKNIVVAVPRLPPARNFIRKYYEEGTNLVQLDDDISEILERIDEKTLKPVKDLSNDVFVKGFEECKANDAYLWGTYAVQNPFFMSNKTAVGLYFCIGVCWGHIVRHSDDLMLTVEEKEDYQRTLQYFTKDGAVVRLNNITAESAYLKEPGGLQEWRTLDTNTQAAEFLEKSYPDLCSMYIRKSTNRAELRLKNKKAVDKNVVSIDQFM